MQKKHLREFVINYLVNNIKKTDLIVDATVGNGHDTLLLAELAKFVYGFDIQQQAIDNTLALLQANNLSNFQLIKDSHENIFNYLSNFKGVIFNLGYLPGSDKAITTTEETTLKTLTTITDKMVLNQFIILTCYPNHDEGELEAEAVFEFAKELDPSFTVLKYEIINNLGKPPFVIVIEKVV
ncbi:MAG: SAM-dependent methyltransferase [Acholeplasmataceae bacterium]|jgi:tRNA G37 N-methylase Trm5|nr:SAM-dependent methyltransferase [Acholeplasmataceae bacterium]